MILPFWKNSSVTAKFGSAFGVFTLLLTMIAVTAYYSLHSVHIAEQTILESTKIQNLVLETERRMEKAQRLHADFFLYYPLIGFSQAYARYARPSAQETAIVLQNCGTLGQMLRSPATSVDLQKSHVDLNLYLSSVQRFAETSAESIELIRKLAAPADGLEAVFAKDSRKLMEAAASQTTLERPIQKMILLSKDYLIDRRRSSMQSSFNVWTEINKSVNRLAESGFGHKTFLLELLAKWKGTAEKILAINVELTSKFNDFSLQAETTEPTSAILIRLARQDVANAHTRIVRAHDTAVVIMSIITVTGLILTVAMAGILSRSITEKIVDLTSCAEKFRQGNLEITADGEGPDELGRLAATFNTMAARIRDLVDSLEYKVQERTQALTESEKRFRAIIENTTQGILIADAATAEFLYANPAIARMLGYNRPEDLIGKTYTDIHPEGIRNTIWQTFKAMVEGKLKMVSDVACLRQDGTIFHADIVAGDVDYGGRACLAGFFLDITEKRNLQTQLEVARKMEAIGMLAGGVAHDLNNILSGIVSYPELILLHLPESSGIRKPLLAIHESGKRAAAVVSDLLTVARGVASTKETTDLNALIDEYLASPEHLEIQSSHVNITCRKDLDPSLAYITCSAIHIKKCLLNLVINAMEAIKGKGFISIATQNQHVDEATAAKAGITPGRYVVLSVADTGHGINEQDLEHIFEPFYTKKVMGKSGTGLGLAVVWNSMKDHDGGIMVESGGGGTVFRLYFPISKEELPELVNQTPLETLRGTGESILVVDDESQQLDIADRILQTLGYKTFCVASGEQAIAYLERNRVDLILLDMIMAPGMSGIQTFEQILRLHPHQKAIIVSGFADSDDVRTARVMGAEEFIKKPYSIGQLGQAVKNTLKK